MNYVLPKKLLSEIEEYCSLNKIDNIQAFMKKITKKGFDLEKWGDLNFVMPVETNVNDTVLQNVEDTKKNVSEVERNDTEEYDIYGDY